MIVILEQSKQLRELLSVPLFPVSLSPPVLLSALSSLPSTCPFSFVYYQPVLPGITMHVCSIYHIQSNTLNSNKLPVHSIVYAAFLRKLFILTETTLEDSTGKTRKKSSLTFVLINLSESSISLVISLPIPSLCRIFISIKALDGDTQ